MLPVSTIELPVPGMELLLAEARVEGFDFVQSLIEDWESAANRFNAPGEILCGCFDRNQLVAVGGLNCDPFAAQPDMGRIRRVYVRPGWRNQGIGRALVNALVSHAQTHFRSVRLRAENADAARLYETLGFLPLDHPDATHILFFPPALLPGSHLPEVGS